MRRIQQVCKRAWVFCAALALVSCAIDEKENAKRVYLAEGYWNLGLYRQSVAHSRKVPPGSEHYGKARELLRKAREYRRGHRESAYDETRIGSPDRSDWRNPPGWPLEIPGREESPE